MKLTLIKNEQSNDDESKEKVVETSSEVPVSEENNSKDDTKDNKNKSQELEDGKNEKDNNNKTEEETSPIDELKIKESKNNSETEEENRISLNPTESTIDATNTEKVLEKEIKKEESLDMSVDSTKEEESKEEKNEKEKEIINDEKMETDEIVEPSNSTTEPNEKEQESETKEETDKEMNSNPKNVEKIKTEESNTSDKPQEIINKVNEDTKSENQKAKPAKEESGSNPAVAAELKTLFPDLEVIEPLARLPQIDTILLNGSEAALQAQPIHAKWPKDYVLHMRLRNIIHCVENKEWPVSRNFNAYDLDHELMQPSLPSTSVTPTGGLNDLASSSISHNDIITITTDLHRGNPHAAVAHLAQQQAMANAAAAAVAAAKKRKRHIAIDVETERAKLHALLNSSATPLGKPSPSSAWGSTLDPDVESLSEDSRRSTPGLLQPPPAHQSSSSLSSGRLLSQLPGFGKPMAPTTIIPGTSSTLTPIDLSSGLTKADKQELMSEVQDFSMPSKRHQQNHQQPPPVSSSPSTSSNNSPLPLTTQSTSKSSSKLDDMLGKLMKRNNCVSNIIIYFLSLFLLCHMY